MKVVLCGYFNTLYILQEELLQSSEREKQIVVQQLQSKNQVRDLLFSHYSNEGLATEGERWAPATTGIQWERETDTQTTADQLTETESRTETEGEYESCLVPSQ